MIIKNKYTEDECYFTDIFSDHKWPFNNNLTTFLTVVSSTALITLAAIQVTSLCISFSDITTNATLSSIYNSPNQYITSDYKDDLSYIGFMFANGLILLIGILSIIPVVKGVLLVSTYINSSTDQNENFKRELYSLFKDYIYRGTALNFEKTRAYLDKVLSYTTLSYLRVMCRPYKFNFIAMIIALANIITFTVVTDKIDDKILKTLVTNGILTQQTVYDGLKHNLSKSEIIRSSLLQINQNNDYHKSIVYVPAQDKFMTREDFFKSNNKRIEDKKIEEQKKIFKITVNKEALKHE